MMRSKEANVMAQETSRREFLALSGAALAAAGLGAYQRPAGRLYAYVGRHTKGPGFGVGGGGGVTVFSVNMSDGSLTEVSKTGPEFDDLNSDGMCVSPDGSLEPACDVSVYARRPVSEPGPGAAAHMVIFDRTERWAIASDNGYDHIYVYPFSPNSRTLEGKAFATPPGKAPRHFVFHPRAPYFFMTNEREASVSSFYFDSNTGELRPVQTIPTIPDAYSGPNVAPSNIRMHPNAKFIYSANRGDDSIAIFSIDEATGRMAPVDIVKTGGRGPREMNFEPSGKYFYVCNLQSNDVTAFAVDASTGKMTQGPKVGVLQAAVINFATMN